MNKTAIKNYAIWARNKLIADITYKAGLMGVSEKGIAAPLPQSTREVQFFDIGTKDYSSIHGDEIQQRESFISAIKVKERDVGYAAAFRYVVEKAAYTWFNRLAAIRFMEVNDYLPSHVRVLSSENPNKAEPDMVTRPFDTDMEFTQEETDFILTLKDENRLDELFRWLFIRQCYKLHEVLPLLFDARRSNERRNDYMELLLTISFTDKDGVLWRLVHDIKEKDFRIRTPEDDERQRIENISEEEMPAGQVEIIGWLYQYYNTEPKDQVFADLKKNIKISKDKIPAATQLFTPDWIVRYMVENSLGRLWVEGHPDEGLKKNWKYYLEEAEQEPEVQAQLAEIRKGYAAMHPEQIKVIDPCMGSGHILVYLFDVLMQIYESQGWTQREAAQSIVRNNIFGLDIDERAAQLAYFAVMMKARQYDRRFLTRGIVPHVYDIRETNDLNPDYLQLFGDLQKKAQTLFDELRDAKTYGSILKLSLTEQDLAALRERLNEIHNKEYDNFFDSARRYGVLYDFPSLLDEAVAMVQKYDVVVTNPPYMGASGMGGTLSQYVKDNYPDSKSDLFSVFIERGFQMLKVSGYESMITMESWMFLSSFEKLRTKLMQEKTLKTLVHMPYLGKGGTSLGINFGTDMAIIQNKHIKGYVGTYDRISYYETDERGIPFEFPVKNEYYKQTTQDNFSKISGSPVAYWVSKAILDSYKAPPLSSFGRPCKGIDTGDNSVFLRMWFEVDNGKMSYPKREPLSAEETQNLKWFPYNKGGDYRRWYGNNDYVLNWENSGAQLRAFSKSNLRNKDCYLKKGITWSTVTSSQSSMRLFDYGYFFDNGGSCLYTNEHLLYILGFLNSSIVKYYLSMSPTLNTQPGDIARLPFFFSKGKESLIDYLVGDCVKLSRSDWDAFETSWDFKQHPLIPAFTDGTIDTYKLEELYQLWEKQCEDRFQQLKANEEELNRIFIDIYGLQDELTPEVQDKDVTVRRADLQRDIKSLLSYAVGCMFGRYSLNRPGLVFAGGDFNSTYWRFKGQAALDEDGEPIYGGYAGITMASYHYPRFKDAADYREATKLKYEPDADNCIPITDEPYLEDDIVGRFVEFIRIVYGENTLEENLSFIAKALGNKGNSSREVIRNYFLNDFFKDHCATYSVTGSGKRPIYWLFDSGKQNGFKALVYMHRWDADTVGNLRVEYLHRMQRVYEKEIERMQDIMDNSHDNREINQAAKRREKLVKQLKETRDYDAKVAHAALSRVEIDLDDGVKANYEKVQKGPDGKSLNILAKI